MSTLQEEHSPPQFAREPGTIRTTSGIIYIVIGTGLVFAVASTAAICRAWVGIKCAKVPPAAAEELDRTQKCGCPCPCDGPVAKCDDYAEFLKYAECCYICKHVKEVPSWRNSTSSPSSPATPTYEPIERFFLLFLYGWHVLANLLIVAIFIFTAIFLRRKSKKLEACARLMRTWCFVRLVHIAMFHIGMLTVFPLSFWYFEPPNVVQQSLWKCCTLELQGMILLIMMTAIVGWLWYLIQKQLLHNIVEDPPEIDEA